jgi:hypothetical protein
LFGAGELVVVVELLLDAAEPGVGGVVRADVSLLVVDGVVAAALARVIEIFTSLGWMPNFSSVDDTASDRAPWKLSSLDPVKPDWLSVSLLFCPLLEVLFSDENIVCR